MSKHLWKILILAGIVFPILIFALARGFSWAYWNSADFDAIPILQSLHFNADKDQTYFDHTGYGFFILVGWLFRFLHFLRVVDVSTIWELIDSPNINQSLTQLVHAEHALSLLLIVAFCFCIAQIHWEATKSKASMLMVALVIAASEGVAAQCIQSRTDLPGVLCTVLAIAFFLHTLNTKSIAGKSLAAFAGGFFLFYGILVTVHVIPLTLLIPLIVYLIKIASEESATLAELSTPRVFSGKLALIAFATLSTFSFVHGRYALDAYPGFFKDLFQNWFGFIKSYQFAILLYALASVFTVLKIFEKDTRTSLWLLLVASNGIFLAWDALKLWPHWENAYAFGDFIGHSEKFRKHSLDIRNLAELANNTFANALEIKTIYGLPDRQIMHFEVFLLYFALASVAVVLWRGLYRKSLALVGLIAINFALQSINAVRYLSSLYRIYSEFLLVLVISLALYLLQREPSRKGRIPKNALLIAVGFTLVSLGLLEGIQRIRTNRFDVVDTRQELRQFCDFADYYSRDLKKFFDDRDGCMTVLNSAKHNPGKTL